TSHLAHSMGRWSDRLATQGTGRLPQEPCFRPVADAVNSWRFQHVKSSREDPMRADKSRICLWLLVIALGFAGCATSESSTAGGPVAITDLASVAGKWVGLLEIAGSQDRQDYIEVTIAGDGTYRAASARTIGVMDARGKITLSDGKLLIQG